MQAFKLINKPFSKPRLRIRFMKPSKGHREAVYGLESVRQLQGFWLEDSMKY